MNPDNDMEDRKRISDITFFKSAMHTKIRCKIDGNWQMGENLSQKDKKRYEEVKLSGNNRNGKTEGGEWQRSISRNNLKK